MGFILLRYGEVALKGSNRFLFIRQLRHNVRATLKANQIAGEVVSRGQRIYVYTNEVDRALEPLTRVFGLVSLSPANEVAREQSAINAACVQAALKAGVCPQVSYRVRARRSDKGYPLTSPEISKSAGEAIHAATGGIVDLNDSAQVTIGVEITMDSAIIFGRSLPAAGGMPVGVEGRAIALLSGGIDSPVAIWMMLKRGCSVIPLHFYSSEQELAKVLDNIQQLQRYCYGWQLRPTILDHTEIIAPLLEQLQAIRETRWNCIFCKRTMLSKASELAHELGAQAIVLGDSLGQVASQTLTNMAVISEGLDMPILRPLIGMDKTEIMAIARKIGTLDISIRSSSVCRFLPNHPVTQGSLEHLHRITAQLVSADQSLEI
ncbi:MAG: tRNA 4-thiouridine(8) synthase ThiI [Chloroflexi bacterium]|nr:tRNA 4-thiouridine(8) synthase ThiI [Chloroflexota bacterium]